MVDLNALIVNIKFLFLKYRPILKKLQSDKTAITKLPIFNQTVMCLKLRFFSYIEFSFCSRKLK